MEFMRSSKIIIVGAGTWGCSTALHLCRRGYNNVLVLDAHPVPSPLSAGNDVNKIVEQGIFSTGDDEAWVSSYLLKAATKSWMEDPVFKPYYHDTGYIVAAHSPEGKRGLWARERPDLNPFVELKTKEDFHATMPKGVLTGDFPGWEGLYKPTGAGWVHARKALVSAAVEAERLGAKFVTGLAGEVVSLLYDKGDVVGVQTRNGTQHRGDRTIICLGASATRLLDFENQLRPTAWTLAHIRMTPQETALFRNLPVLFNIEKGFFMEPDEDNHDLKLCDEHPGYCNWVDKGNVPFIRDEIPVDAARRIRDLLQDTMPHLASRPFSVSKICWCADTPNRSFLIDVHPKYPSLVLGVGGSGHGFMHIPTVGGFIVDVMEGKLDGRLKHSFRWRPETAQSRDWMNVQGRFGGPNAMTNFQDVKEWTVTGI